MKYVDTGLGTKHDSQPISVKHFPVVDGILRDKELIEDRSSYIRQAVLRRIVKDENILKKLDESKKEALRELLVKRNGSIGASY